VPLRILHVTPYYEHAWAYGGIPRLAAALTHELARRGHRVTVCTTDARDDRARLTPPQGSGDTARAWPPVTSADGVEVRVFPNWSNHLAYEYQAFAPLGLSRFLRDHAREFDIAHLHACHHLPGALAARHLRRARVPYVLAPNGTAPRLERRRLAKWIFDATVGREVVPRAARVLAVSEAERRQLLGLGVPHARIVVVPNPVDLREFEDVPPSGRFRARLGLGPGPIVLYLGKLTPRKRLDVLVDAFASLRREPAWLVIAGNDMGVGSAVRARIERLRLDGVARMPGLLVGRARLEALADAAVVVYPSQDEVFGLVPFEALLCGTPVVVADDSGCGEHLGRTGGGVVAPVGDAAAFAAGIGLILDEPDRWRAEAAAAATRVRASFDAAVVCGQIERVYEEIASTASRHGSAS
jgi:glycosyltransferase involved in cell wall biosynthesis